MWSNDYWVQITTVTINFRDGTEMFLFHNFDKEVFEIQYENTKTYIDRNHKNIDLYDVDIELIVKTFNEENKHGINLNPENIIDFLVN